MLSFKEYLLEEDDIQRRKKLAIQNIKKQRAIALNTANTNVDNINKQYDDKLDKELSRVDPTHQVNKIIKRVKSVTKHF